MKIIVTYASAGSGHFSAAQAVYNHFKEKNPRLEIELIDVMAYSNRLFRFIYISGYVFLVRYLPILWAIGFSITCAKFMQPIIRWVFFPMTMLNTKRFTKLLIQESPDVIISTHFLASEIAAFLKRNKKINSKIVTVITDFGVHPFWIQEGTDIYTAASDITRAKLVSKGISEEKIKVIGIPVHAGFSKKSEKSELFGKLNIEENKFTVLVLTGSFGIGPLEKIVEMLHRDAQVLVVCARNKKLLLKLKNKNYPQVRVFGFVDEIYDFMSISDIVITKPGGLTVSELLVMELAPIFISAIPGQETENVKALRIYGIGSLVKNASDVRDEVLDYKLNPEKLKRVKENIRLIRKLNTLEDLYNVVC